MKKITIIIALFVSCLAVQAQKLLTIAESSDFNSTSTYNDVITYIDKLKKTSTYIRTETIATTTEGKDIPLIIIGNPLPRSPLELKNDKRVVIYIQGNIHAGEVEGKEATLMYARDLLNEKNAAVLRNVVLLICPILNADGNDKISTKNRTDQNGPANGVGVRYNGQFLDLNRDAMKAESPEVRGILKNVFGRWDPSVFMDCHTTNGSFHVEPVTFIWMINPNGDRSLISFMQNRMMPEISSMLRNRYNVENCFYGEFIDMLHPEKGWIADAVEPRYMTNYFGLRNRLGILNENYVYAPFRDRVYGCYNLIRSLMDYSSGHSTEIREMLRKTDSLTVLRRNKPSVNDSFAIEYKVRPLPEKATIKTYEAELIGVENGWPRYRNTKRQVDVTVPFFNDWYAVKSVKLPFAYVLAVKDPDVLDLLKTHGIQIEKLVESEELNVESFVIGGLKGNEALNQGHRTSTITGEYKNETHRFDAGTIIIRTGQPLANVAAYLLEPQSDDGLLTWNYLDKYLVPQWGAGYNPYPVYKIQDKADMKTVILQ